MRSVLYIACALLLIASSHRWLITTPAAGAPGTETVSEMPADHSVHIFSAGYKLGFPMYGQRIMYRGFFVDSVFKKGTDGTKGLSVIELPAAGGVLPLHQFDLHEPVNNPALNEYLDGVELDSVLIMGGFASVGLATWKPYPQEYRDAVAASFRRMGATSDPTQVAVQSFALVCIKTEEGFKPIIESFSKTKGLQLSYLVPKDRTKLRTIEPRLIIDQRKIRDLKLATAIGEDFKLGNPEQRFDGHAYPNLKASLTDKTSPTVDFELDEESYPSDATQPSLFRARLVMVPHKADDMLGVRLLLHINNVLAGERMLLLGGSETRQWVNWEEPLRGLDGPIKQVTISAEWIGTGPGSATVYVGLPQLISTEE